jgi:hypothetical protein
MSDPDDPLEIHESAKIVRGGVDVPGDVEEKLAREREENDGEYASIDGD